MPERGYAPVPTVSPKEIATPAVNVHFPEVRFSDAIGRALGELGRGYGVLGNAQGQVGAALAHMGGTFERVGDEIFARAAAIKSVENATAATEAETKFRIEADKIQDAFETTSGNAASQGLDAHMKSLEDLRQKIRGTLKNPEQFHMFEQHSLRALGSFITKAGKHGVTQSKNAAVKAALAEFDLAANDIYKDPDNPDNDRRIEEKKQKYRDTVAPILGEVGPTQELALKKLDSKFLASRIKGLGRDPARAFELLERSRERMMDYDIDQVEKSLRVGDIDVAARNISRNATQELRENKTEAQRENDPTERDVVNKALKEFDAHPRLSNDIAARDVVIDRAKQKFREEKEFRQNEEIKAEKSVQAVILGKKHPEGKRPKNMEEFKAQGGDEAMAALDALPFKKQMSYRKIIMSADHLDSPEIQREHDAWKSMATLHEDAETIKRVLDTNFFEKPWPVDRISDMFNRQLAIMKGEHKNVALDEAMKIADLSLPTSMSAQNDPDKRNEFRGALLTNIQTYQQIFHSYPDRTKIEAFTKEWLKKESKAWPGLWSSERFYLDNVWHQKSKALHPDWTLEQHKQEYRLEKSRQMLEYLYKDQIPAELPAMKWIRERGGLGR